MGDTKLISKTSGGGGSFPAGASIVKAGTETCVEGVAKQITFANAFSGTAYNVELDNAGGTITDQLATGFKITADFSGTINWVATYKTT